MNQLHFTPREILSPLLSYNMLQEDLQHDQIIVNEMCNKATTR